MSTIELGLNTFGDVAVGIDEHGLTHSQAIRDAVQQGVLADQVGVDFFGVGEHHRPDFAISCPEIVLSAIAGQTRRIQLGSSATVLSSDDPVRLFQRFSTLNALANGRVQVIMGRGWFSEAFELFGFSLSDYDTLFEEKLELFVKLTRHEVVNWRGTSRPELKRRRIYPPLESGSLKTWVAVGSTPDSVVRAARLDLPVMIAAIGGEPERFKPLADLYRAGCTKLSKEPGSIGIHSAGYIAKTDALAYQQFWPCYKAARDRIGQERGWPSFSQSQFDAEIARGSLYVGAPEIVALRIARSMKVLGASRFDMRYGIGQPSHEQSMSNIDLYGTKVIPMVRELLRSSSRVRASPRHPLCEGASHAL